MRTVDSFFAIPSTPNERLRIDICRRFNALNQKKIKRIKKDNERRRLEHEHKVRVWERQEARRQGLATRREQPREEAFTVKGILALLKRARIWMSEEWELRIVPAINRLFRAAAFLMWLKMIVSHKQRGDPWFALKVGMFMP